MSSTARQPVPARAARPRIPHRQVEPLESRTLLSTVSIAGEVVHDLNGDGVRGPEERGVPGWMIWADHVRNNIIDPGEPTATTDRLGRFALNDLPAGVTTLRIAQQPGWWTLPDYHGFSVPAGAYTLSPWLVYNEPYLSAHTHRSEPDGWGASPLDGVLVYLDLDGDAQPDPGEPSGRSRYDGGVQFTLAGLPAGTYALREVTPPGYRRISPDPGAEYSVTLPAAQPIWVGSFRYTDMGSIRGTVYRDVNRNGVRDQGEPPFSNPIYIDQNNDGQRTFPEPVAFVNADGEYHFDEIQRGTYALRPWHPPEGWAQTHPAGEIAHHVTVVPGEVTAPVDFGFARRWRAWVSERRVFYDNSVFDADTPAGPGSDQRAVATDKTALRPGGSAGFANVTSYDKGINGLLLDLLDPGAETLSAEDFDFAVADFPSSTAWTPAPPPTAVVLGGPTYPTIASPIPDLRQVKITWPDGAIRNRWLRVTVKANFNTNLSREDVFYFGNLVGDTGGRAAPGAAASVDALDLLRTRRAASPTASITNPHDHNRDGRVSPADYAIARSNLSRRLGTIPLPVAAPSKVREEEVGDLLSSWHF